MFTEGVADRRTEPQLHRDSAHGRDILRPIVGRGRRAAVWWQSFCRCAAEWIKRNEEPDFVLPYPIESVPEFGVTPERLADSRQQNADALTFAREKQLRLLQHVDGHDVSSEPEDRSKFAARFRATPALLTFCTEHSVEPTKVYDHFEFEFDLPKDVLELRATKPMTTG